MVYSVKAILAVLITIIMQTCAVNMVESTPTAAAEDFLSAVKKQDQKVMERYMDNDYVNFLCNSEGDDKSIDKMNDALFENFEYEVLEVKEKGDVAVAKVMITSCDFSKVMDSYAKVAYKYIMDNLYEKEIGDKEKLNKKCLELYVNEVEKVAEKGKTVENTVVIPMVDDGYYGWNVIMTDELMESILGNLEMPTQK